MSDPITNPASRNLFTLDTNIVPPGIAVLMSGGNQHEDIQDMGQPLTRGENTIVRHTKNIVAVYQIRLWLPEHFAGWDAFEAMLWEGKQRTPPRNYVFKDPRVPRLTKAIVEDIGPEKSTGRGGLFYHEVTWHQWTRLALYGGAVRPPKTAVQQQIDALTPENQALANQLAAAEAAARKGK